MESSGGRVVVRGLASRCRRGRPWRSRSGLSVAGVLRIRRPATGWDGASAPALPDRRALEALFADHGLPARGSLSVDKRTPQSPVDGRAPWGTAAVTCAGMSARVLPARLRPRASQTDPSSYEGQSALARPGGGLGVGQGHCGHRQDADLALALSLPATTAHAAQERAAVPQVLPIGVAVSALPVAVEDRTCTAGRARERAP